MTKGSARPQTRYVCQSCGESFLRWEGQCRACSTWNSLVETQVRSEPRASRSLTAASASLTPVATRLADVGEPERPRLPIGIDTLTLRHLGVGEKKVDLTFQRVGDRVVAFLADRHEGLVPLIVRS